MRLDLYVNDVTFRRMEDNLNSLTLYGENALNLLLSKINSNPIMVHWQNYYTKENIYNKPKIQNGLSDKILRW